MRSFAGRDILSLKDFERAEFEHIFEVANRLEPIARERRNSDLLSTKTLLTAFYQPSTRTRLAHEAAMHRLGGAVLGFADPKMTRAGDFYQESIKDTVHMLEYYADVIVMRHFQQGAPQRGGPLVERSDHQRRRRLGGAPHPGSHRSLHGDSGARRCRRAHLPVHRRRPDAHDALHRVRPHAVRRPGHLRLA